MFLIFKSWAYLMVGRKCEGKAIRFPTWIKKVSHWLCHSFISGILLLTFWSNTFTYCLNSQFIIDTTNGCQLHNGKNSMLTTLIRTVNCDVNSRMKATWCHYIKKKTFSICVSFDTKWKMLNSKLELFILFFLFPRTLSLSLIINICLQIVFC